VAQEVDLWIKWVDLISKTAVLLSGLIVAAVTAFWAYARFVLERGLLPPSEFSVDCGLIGEQRGRTILEVRLKIRNAGSATLIVSNLRADIRYLETSETPNPFREPTEKRFGVLKFPKSLLKDDLEFAGKIFVGKEGELIKHGDKTIRVGKEAADEQGPAVIVNEKNGAILGGEIVKPPKKAKVWEAEERGGRGIPLLRYDTFVQPGVTQEYAFVTAVSASAACVLVYSSFRYGIHPRPFEAFVLKIARGIGLTHYSLSHITEPHTAQRVFDVTLERPPRSSRKTSGEPAAFLPEPGSF
jgi:hypothetical protein